MDEKLKEIYVSGPGIEVLILQQKKLRYTPILQQPHSDENKFYFYHWTNHRRLNIIETILLLGFELELYGPHEYTMIYW